MPGRQRASSPIVAVQVIREFCRLVVSTGLLTLAGFLYYWAISVESSGGAVGFSSAGLIIIEAEIWYWLVRKKSN